MFNALQLYLADALVETSAGELDMIPPSHFIRTLHHILDDAAEPADDPVGILTAETRDTWYQARQELLQSLEQFYCKLSVVILSIIFRSNQQGKSKRN